MEIDDLIEDVNQFHFSICSYCDSQIYWEITDSGKHIPHDVINDIPQMHERHLCPQYEVHSKKSYRTLYLKIFPTTARILNYILEHTTTDIESSALKYYDVTEKEIVRYEQDTRELLDNLKSIGNIGN